MAFTLDRHAVLRGIESCYTETNEGHTDLNDLCSSAVDAASKDVFGPGVDELEIDLDEVEGIFYRIIDHMCDRLEDSLKDGAIADKDRDVLEHTASMLRGPGVSEAEERSGIRD